MTQHDENLEVDESTDPPPPQEVAPAGVAPEIVEESGTAPDEEPPAEETDAPDEQGEAEEASADVEEEAAADESEEGVEGEDAEEASSADASGEDMEVAPEEEVQDAGDAADAADNGEGEGDADAVEEDPVVTDMPAYEEVDEAALIDFDEVRPQIEAIIERDELAEAQELLEKIALFPDTTRHIPDNVWLYRTLGDLRRAGGDAEAARLAYETAYGFDPRELHVLRPYSALLIERGAYNDALEVLRALILYHKRDLNSARLVEVYRQMGTCYEAVEDHDRARASYEKALEQSQQDRDILDGLLRVVATSGSPEEIIKVRQRLIRTLDSPTAKASAMVALGDDWVEKFNDPQRALDTYEQALIEDGENRQAVQRIASIATETEDWRRVSRAYFTLSRLAEEPDEEADWLIKAALVARDQLWEPEKALGGFKRALELDPTRLDAFKIVTSILIDAAEWEDLKRAYINQIAAMRERPDVDTKLLVVLWQNLGEVYKNYLDNRHEAIVAYHQASLLVPNDAELHETVAALAEKDEEHFDIALDHLNSLRTLHPEDTDVLDRIGRVYLRKKEVDHAYCIFRALDYMGTGIDDKAKGFVERFKKPIYKAPKQPLTLELMQRYIFHEQLDKRISRIFTTIKPALGGWAGQSRKKYGLRRRDRLKLDEQLTFTNIYRSIGGLLQYPDLPDLWRKPEQPGLINGALVPDGMIVGDELLGSGREKHVAFIVGKQLFLFLAPFYLAAIRPADLPAYFMLAMMIAFPDTHSIDLQGEMTSAYKALNKNLGRDQIAKLAKSLRPILDEYDDRMDFQTVSTVVNHWLEAVEDSANRAGLVFCDDLEVCEQYLSDEPQRISQRPVDERMRALAEFSMSDAYIELRSILGINVA